MREEGWGQPPGTCVPARPSALRSSWMQLCSSSDARLRLAVKGCSFCGGKHRGERGRAALWAVGWEQRLQGGGRGAEGGGAALPGQWGIFWGHCVKAGEEWSGGGCGCEAKSKRSYCFPGDARETQKLLHA